MVSRNQPYFGLEISQGKSKAKWRKHIHFLSGKYFTPSQGDRYDLLCRQPLHNGPFWARHARVGTFRADIVVINCYSVWFRSVTLSSGLFADPGMTKLGTKAYIKLTVYLLESWFWFVAPPEFCISREEHPNWLSILAGAPVASLLDHLGHTSAGNDLFKIYKASGPVRKLFRILSPRAIASLKKLICVTILASLAVAICPRIQFWLGGAIYVLCFILKQTFHVGNPVMFFSMRCGARVTIVGLRVLTPWYLTARMANMDMM